MEMAPESNEREKTAACGGESDVLSGVTRCRCVTSPSPPGVMSVPAAAESSFQHKICRFSNVVAAVRRYMFIYFCLKSFYNSLNTFSVLYDTRS